MNREPATGRLQERSMEKDEQKHEDANCNPDSFEPGARRPTESLAIFAHEGANLFPRW
jgi:hypothetical protein